MVSHDGQRLETTVAIDAMGGDNAPDEVLAGALAAQRRGVRVVVVGPQNILESRMHAMSATIPIVHAPDVIDMHEPVTPALRHRESTLKVAATMVQNGGADAVVSCGNSAAIYFVAFHLWGTQPGIDRPAFGGTLPARDGSVFVLDIGANTAVTASNLVQFAVMGDVYMRLAHGLAAPRVALLSIGHEDSKGTREVKEANKELRKLDLNFVGNVEGNEVFNGEYDVVVCDGFVGNVLLKGGEGVVSELLRLLRAELTRRTIDKLLAAALRPAFNRVRTRLDYEEYGGAPVLGVNGVMVNCHGRSRAKAVTNAILLADKMARERLVDRIGEALHVDDEESAGTRKRLARALRLRGSGS